MIGIVQVVNDMLLSVTTIKNTNEDKRISFLKRHEWLLLKTAMIQLRSDHVDILWVIALARNFLNCFGYRCRNPFGMTASGFIYLLTEGIKRREHGKKRYMEILKCIPYPHCPDHGLSQNMENRGISSHRFIPIRDTMHLLFRPVFTII